uniref:DHC_N1 domain-containing protein n=1 Tax=Angiostrongylus cantonensis TaxID=6313 RepID=A0A0K0DJN9_ANGCA
MDAGNEGSVVGVAPIEVAIATKESVTEYVKNAGLALLGTSSKDAQLEIVLEESDALVKFITDPQTHVLVVDRTIHRDQSGDADTGDESETALAVFTVRNDVLYRTDRSTSIVFIKKGGIIEADKSIPDQLRVMVLSEGNPCETLCALIGRAVTPYFKSFIKESGRGERDGDKLAPIVEKNLNEAEVALLHLQQNIDIPEINLIINPHIQAAIQKASKEGRKAKASSGSSLQEMAFWLNLERALQKILQKRESEEVMLTLEALKCGKRFHATVSLDTDTGLKQTLALVSDYNSLMKDFPLNELVSATDLDSIKIALGNVFGHMKKIRYSNGFKSLL